MENNIELFAYLLVAYVFVGGMVYSRLCDYFDAKEDATLGELNIISLLWPAVLVAFIGAMVLEFVYGFLEGFGEDDD
jgi:hypothetical protein